MCNPYTKTSNKDKFAYSDKWNSCCLTSWGCFQRHKTQRWEQEYNEPYYTHFGDWDIPLNFDEYEEIQLLYTAIELIQQGYIPRKKESLTKFIMTH